MQTTCSQHADDMRVRFWVRFHQQMTYVIHTSSACHLDTCLSCPISCSTTPGVICTSSADTHVIRMSSAHYLQICTSFAQSSCTPIVFPVPKILVIDLTVVPDVALLKTYCLHIIPGSLCCPYGSQLCFLSQKYQLLMSLWFLMWTMCVRHSDNVQMTCGQHKSEISLEIWLVDDICRLDVIRKWIHHLHIIRRHVHHWHIVCRHICHPYIIYRTPHGHCGPELSFYCDQNWLLNGICRKNVELFHFSIMYMICEIICIDGFLCMSHLDIVHILSAYVHVIHILSGHMHIMHTLFSVVLDIFLPKRQCQCHPYVISSTLYISYHVELSFCTLSAQMHIVHVVCMLSAHVHIICLSSLTLLIYPIIHNLVSTHCLHTRIL